MPMRQPVTYAQLKSMIPSNRSLACVQGARLSRFACLLAAWVTTLSFVAASPANGQTPTTATIQSAAGASTGENAAHTPPLRLTTPIRESIAMIRRVPPSWHGVLHSTADSDQRHPAAKPRSRGGVEVSVGGSHAAAGNPGQ